MILIVLKKFSDVLTIQVILLVLRKKKKKKETALALLGYFSVVYFFSDGDFCVFKRF